MKRIPTKTSLMKKADRLFSNYWRNEIGRCEHCGTTETLQLAHITTRNVRKLRYERRNTLVLCASCHRHFHNKPLAFTKFIGELKGQDIVDWLIRESNKLEPLTLKFYQDVIKGLTNISKGV